MSGSKLRPQGLCRDHLRFVGWAVCGLKAHENKAQGFQPCGDGWRRVCHTDVECGRVCAFALCDKGHQPERASAYRLMGVLQPAVGSHAVPVKSHRSRGIFEAGWDLRRFAALAHHDFSTFSSGGPALEANWSHPTLKKQIALGRATRRSSTFARPAGGQQRLQRATFAGRFFSAEFVSDF